MDFKVLITDNAFSDLREIVSFVAQDDAPAATRLGEKLIQCALSLRTMPARFPIHDRKRGIRKMTAAPYLIFYLDDEAIAAVYILHFWHGSRCSPKF